MQEKHDTPATALWSAALGGHLGLVKHLVSEGVDVNVWDHRGRCALTWAATRGDVAMVRFLIDSGAWVDPWDDYSTFMSPLMCAAKNGRLEVVELLLACGANPTIYGGIAGRTAQSYASGGLIAAILRRAEDSWRRAHPRV